MTQLAEKFSNIIVSKRNSEGEIEETIKVLKSINDVMKQNNGALFSMLSSPIVPNKDKVHIIEKIKPLISSDKDHLIPNLLMILIKIKKIELLPDILQNLENWLLKSKGFSETWVLFASKPSESQIKLVESILIDEIKIKPQINAKVNDHVVAGFVAFFDGKMLDASLHNTFERLASLEIQ